MKDTLQELFMDTYKQTIKDNQKDFLKIINIISKLCVILASKNIINEEELKEILDMDKNIVDLDLDEIMQDLESKGE